MIKLNVNINVNDIFPNKLKKYKCAVNNSLEQISDLVPQHKSGNFNDNLWGPFKLEILNQQGTKCAYCEKELVPDISQVEHFRPKSETRCCDVQNSNKDNKLINKVGYWWLAYDHKNYLVSCSTCNQQKGRRFPIQDERTREAATDMSSIKKLDINGSLGDEIPNIINPRYKDPEPHFKYIYVSDIEHPLVWIDGKDEIGEITIYVLDLNRRKKKDGLGDLLPLKRGTKLKKFRKKLREYDKLLAYLEKLTPVQASNPHPDLKAEIESLESQRREKMQNISNDFLIYKAEFSGECRNWLRNERPYAADFLGITA